MKRLISLLVCVSLVLTLVPAIGIAEGGGDLKVVRFLSNNDYDNTSKTEDWANYAVSQIIIDELAELGLAVEFECIDGSAFTDTVRTRMAIQQDLPDVVSWCWRDQAEVEAWADAGLVMNVTDMLAKYDEDGSILAYWEQLVPGSVASLSMPDGNLYWFTYLMASQYYDKETGKLYDVYANTGNTLELRYDWLQKIGVEYKIDYSPEELKDILIAFRDQDVNGNGQQDEVFNINISSFNTGTLNNAYGLHTGIVASYGLDDVVYSNFTAEKFPEYVEYLHELYELGIIDTASMTSSDEILAANRAGAGSSYPMWSDWEPQVPDPDCSYAPAFLDYDGDPTTGFTYGSQLNTGTYCQYFVPATCQDPESVVKLMEYVYTDHYAALNAIGIEGVSYELDENGVAVMLTDGVDMSTIENRHTYGFFRYAAGLYGMPSVVCTKRYGEGTILDGDSEGMKRKKQFLTTINGEYGPYMSVLLDTEQLAIATPEEKERLDEITTELETYCTELLTGLILGTKSLDDLNKYVDEMNSLGLQDYIDIKQARRDRYLGK